MSVDSLDLLFRDYTQSLLKMAALSACGHVCGGEYASMPASIRGVQLTVGGEQDQDQDDEQPWHTFDIERSMTPFKLYHDVCARMRLFTFAYGPCWEGCMAELNMSLERIVHPQRDPSRSMPWWDKARLYVHGRLSAAVAKCQIVYHVSMDPYNHTEGMKLQWSDLYFDWTNALLVFRGLFNIYLNTESKYDDCCLLHVADLEMRLRLDWLCRASTGAAAANCNAHNRVVPCAPDKLTANASSSSSSSSLQQHDSFAHFRSEKLNVSLSFAVIGSSSKNTTNDGGETNSKVFYY